MAVRTVRESEEQGSSCLEFAHYLPRLSHLPDDQHEVQETALINSFLLKIVIPAWDMLAVDPS